MSGESFDISTTFSTNNSEKITCSILLKRIYSFKMSLFYSNPSRLKHIYYMGEKMDPPAEISIQKLKFNYLSYIREGFTDYVFIANGRRLEVFEILWKTVTHINYASFPSRVRKLMVYNHGLAGVIEVLVIDKHNDLWLINFNYYKKTVGTALKLFPRSVDLD